MTDTGPTLVCAHCGGDIPADEAVWINPDESTIEPDGAGDPYHEECIP